ncbi:hypothetical protein C0991_011817, partial [Blastosporella zonata]
MATKALETLQKGLSSLKKQIKTRRDSLLKQLSEKQTISDADANWLDHEGNPVDEERVLE